MIIQLYSILYVFHKQNIFFPHFLDQLEKQWRHWKRAIPEQWGEGGAV
jgi:hypothetical protein